MQGEFQTKITEAEAVATVATVNLPTAKLGDKGSAVRILQRILIASCYLDSTHYNAVFDQYTLKAIKAFQTDHSLAVDGIVGAQTWYKLTDHIYGPCLPYSQ